jgi:hypothetical protein
MLLETLEYFHAQSLTPVEKDAVSAAMHVGLKEEKVRAKFITYTSFYVHVNSI